MMFFDVKREEKRREGVVGGVSDWLGMGRSN